MSFSSTSGRIITSLCSWRLRHTRGSRRRSRKEWWTTWEPGSTGSTFTTLQSYWLRYLVISFIRSPYSLSWMDHYKILQWRSVFWFVCVKWNTNFIKGFMIISSLINLHQWSLTFRHFLTLSFQIFPHSVQHYVCMSVFVFLFAVSLHTAVYIPLRLLHGVRSTQETGEKHTRCLFSIAGHTHYNPVVTISRMLLVSSLPSLHPLPLLQPVLLLFWNFLIWDVGLVCFLFSVWVPAGPAGGRDRKPVVEGGAGGQLRERSSGSRGGAQCQWQRGERIINDRSVRVGELRNNNRGRLRVKNLRSEIITYFFCLCFFFFFFTGSGESDAHCWAEATHAAEGFPRHLKLHSRLQSTSISSLPCFPTFASFHDHPSVQSRWPLLTLLYTRSSASFFLSLPHLTPIMLQGHRMARLYLPFLILILHVLASEHHIHHGYTCRNVSDLIAKVNFFF